MSALTYYPIGTLIVCKFRYLHGARKVLEGDNGYYQIALEGFYFGYKPNSLGDFLPSIVSDSKTLRVKAISLNAPIEIWSMAFFPEYDYRFVVPD